MPPQNTKKSLISIDIARATAALGVFYYHQHTGSVLAKYSGIKQFNVTDFFGAIYAVPLFFLISGYCIHLSNIKYLKAQQSLPIFKYYKRRLLRIYPPYLIALVFSVAVNFITVDNYSLHLSDFFNHLFLLQGFSVPYFNSINLVFWTITIEMSFYVIYPLFYFVRTKLSSTVTLLLIFIISSISIAYFSNRSNVSIPQYYCVFNLWFAWCCGAYLADKIAFDAVSLKQPVFKILYMVILLLFVFFELYKPANWNIVKYQINILIWTAPLVFLLNKEHWFQRRKLYVIRIFAAIGLSSYSLYLLHEPLIALKNYLVHLYLPYKLQPAGVLIGIFLIPVITWFSYLYIEKPFMSKKPVAI